MHRQPAERDAIEAQIFEIDKEIHFYDKRLLELRVTKPLQNLIKREVKIRSKQKLDELRQSYRERSIIKQNAALRGSIKNVSSSLITYITKPTNQKHIPEALKKPVTEFLASIDFVSAKANPYSFTTATWNDKMTKLYNVLSALKDGNDDTGMMEGFDKDLLVAMRDFQKENAGKKLSDMGTKSLEDLYLITRALRLNINNANKMFVNERSQSVEDVAIETARELEKKKDKKSRSKVVRMLDNLVNCDNLDPFTFFERLGTGAWSVLKGLRKGWNVMEKDIRQSTEFLEKDQKKKWG